MCQLRYFAKRALIFQSLQRWQDLHVPSLEELYPAYSVAACHLDCEGPGGTRPWNILASSATPKFGTSSPGRRPLCEASFAGDPQGFAHFLELSFTMGTVGRSSAPEPGKVPNARLEEFGSSGCRFAGSPLRPGRQAESHALEFLPSNNPSDSLVCPSRRKSTMPRGGSESRCLHCACEIPSPAI